MNKQQLYMAGSVLLATTALSSAANAGIISTAISAGNALGGTAVVAKSVANTLFSTTAATANAVVLGPTQIFIAFSNNFTTSTKFSVELDPINAGFVVQQIDAKILLSSAGSFSIALTAAAASTFCSAVTPLTTKIILDGCQTGSTFFQTSGANTDVSATYGGVLFSGVSFNNASGMASVGATIGLSGLVYNFSNPSQSFESITAANILTSAAPVAVSVGPTSGSSATVNSSATPVAFAYFVVGSGGASFNTLNLAYVDITGTGALAADLVTVLEPESGTTTAISSIQVTVASGALSQAGSVGLSITGGTPNSLAAANYTVANFSAGVATFSIDPTGGFTSFTIQVAFSGTAAIAAASAGTVTVAFGVGVGQGQAVATVVGKTASITLGGFNAELNTFLTSSNTSFSSFARIHNNGIIAAAATVTVRNDATGVSMGVFTTAAIATNQTLQISAKDIEVGAGITPAAGVNYTLSLSGAFSGYAQHIIFNPATGQLADLSAFRNRGGAGVTIP